MPDTIAETDVHQWALDTAEAIKTRRFEAVDWERVAEEIEDLSISQRRELQSRLTQLMYHLLKAQYQPRRRSKSWDRSVREKTRAIQLLLETQPSLKRMLADPVFWRAAYADTAALATSEDLPAAVADQFPDTCPFTPQILET